MWKFREGVLPSSPILLHCVSARGDIHIQGSVYDAVSGSLRKPLFGPASSGLLVGFVDWPRYESFFFVGLGVTGSESHSYVSELIIHLSSQYSD